MAQLNSTDHFDSPDAKRSYNKRLFTEVAPRYDLITRILSLGRDASWKRMLIRQLPKIASPSCIDLACGTGDITRMLSERFPTGRIIGLDLTPEMLILARAADPESKATYIQADMCHTELDDASIDIVTGGYALRNAPDLALALHEIHRILKPMGCCALLDFSKPRSLTMQRVEHFILKFWGNLWGLLFHRNPAVYGYIADSLARFPDRDALTVALNDAGFEPTMRKRLMLGAVELIYFTKTK